MPKTPKILTAAALALALLSGAASAASVSPLQDTGIVIQPASASPTQDQSKRGKLVLLQTKLAPGSIIVKTKEHALYFVLGNNRALKYRVATAKKGFEWSGTHKISWKTRWPDWRPPAEMRERRPELPEYMEGGPENPLGARAIYIGGTIYRIHGTNEPKSIGKSASSGCIRMFNEDVTELYQFVKPGATVSVL